MQILNFNGDNKSSKKINSKTKILFGVGLLILIPVIGSTLAASITLNSGSSIQFGQGVSQAVACDTDGVTITPSASFANSSGAGQFNLGTVVISGIADNCASKNFILNAYGDTGNALTMSSGGTHSPGCYATPTTWSSSTITSESSNNCVGTISAHSTNANSITFTLASTLNATTIYKFTLETT